jgi:hypothetical protein
MFPSCSSSKNIWSVVFPAVEVIGDFLYAQLGQHKMVTSFYWNYTSNASQ